MNAQYLQMLIFANGMPLGSTTISVWTNQFNTQTQCRSGAMPVRFCTWPFSLRAFDLVSFSDHAVNTSGKLAA